MARAKKKAQLSPLEAEVMDVLWSAGRATAEEVRQALRKTQPLNGSTVRTLLRRLEAKGYLEHDVEGRTYVYRPRVESQRVAAEAVRGIIERFCEGSVENLLLGMVGDRILTPEKLEELARKIAAAQAAQEKRKRRKRD